jgi:RNA polymerase sigma-70 factor, ECF subfamily
VHGTLALPGPVALAELRALVAAELGIALSTVQAPGSPGGRPAGAPPEGNPQGERIAALVTLAQQGDGEAFGEIYDAYVDSIYRYLYYRVGSHAVAEDLTSETFLRALRRIDSFTWQGKDIGAWFVTIARNLVADHVKSSRFRLEVTTADMLDADRADEGIEDEVLSRLQNAVLLDAVKALKPEQQECIVLRFLQGLTVAETSDVMGRSEGAIKQLQLRAVRALAKLMPERVS